MWLFLHLFKKYLFYKWYFVFVSYDSTGSGVHYNWLPSSNPSGDLRKRMLPAGHHNNRPPPTLNLNPTLPVCVLSLYVTLPLSDSSSRGLWHDSQIKRITLPPTCAPIHTDRAALLILPSAPTLAQITSQQPLGLNRDGSSCLSPDLLWSQTGIKLVHRIEVPPNSNRTSLINFKYHF